MEKYKYNSWPIGKVPIEFQRPELEEVKAIGYNWNDPRDIVDMFEQQLAKFAGSKYAVTVDCCTHAMELAMRYLLHTKEIDTGDAITIPRQTYISVYHMLTELNFIVSLKDIEWSGIYQLGNTRVYDGAVRFTEGMYKKGTLHCVSFQIKKILCIGRGGVILCDNKEEYDFLKLMSYDGRDLTLPYTHPEHVKLFGFHYYLPPEECARGLILMNSLPKINNDSGTNDNYPYVDKMILNLLKTARINSKYVIGNNKQSLEMSQFLSKRDIDQKNILIHKYIIKKQSISEIAKLLNTTSRDRIRKLLKYHGINIRTEHFIDLTNKKLGDITVIKQNGHNKHGQIVWLCQCSCGHLYSVESTILNRSIIKSCHFCANTGSKSGQWTGYGEISGSHFAAIKANAKSRNLEFFITIEEIWNKFLLQDKKCALSGIPLTFNTHNKSTDGNASLDRIDNNIGYTYNNVQWIHKDINYMKQDYDEKYFITMCDKISQNITR